jgi:hypothetical protein
MKYLVAVAVLACVASTAAVAKPKSGPLQHYAAAAQDPYGVYVDGEMIGRDPDPAIRAQIRAGYCGRFAPVGGAR